MWISKLCLLLRQLNPPRFAKMSHTCHHSSLCFSPSAHAAATVYKRPGERQRVAATKSNIRIFSGQDKHFLDGDSRVFPAPLILPGDDLTGDAEQSQSFQAWLDGETRNPVTAKKKTIYVVSSPQIEPGLELVREWTKPKGSTNDPQTEAPSTEDIKEYLAAFYHGLPVKMMPPSTLSIMPWEKTKKRTRKPISREQYLGLNIGDECVRIRARTCPDGVYGGQLNLDDLLDAAITILPKDAYALILLVDFDLYEDEDDEFVCGRAYGGSRVAVVSSARYDPSLDGIQQIERIHAWPASHCVDYISSCVSAEPVLKKQKTRVDSKSMHKSMPTLDGPMKDAVLAYQDLPDVGSTPSLMYALWLGRMCRTASHELGHCFGIAHCVYYACSMQGTASICEDARQPAYLCPVDLTKLLHATGSSAYERYEALLTFCERPKNIDTHFFGPFAAWIRSRLRLSEE
ncbi:unnamed protein product [Penicillium salamii]|nr:unnamed protein product [Penicillium salamii]